MSRIAFHKWNAHHSCLWVWGKSVNLYDYSAITMMESTIPWTCHCGDRIILPGKQNWQQVVKILPKSCDPTVWNSKMWLGKIQTTCCNILPPCQNSPTLALIEGPLEIYSMHHLHYFIFSAAETFTSQLISHQRSISGISHAHRPVMPWLWSFLDTIILQDSQDSLLSYPFPRQTHNPTRKAIQTMKIAILTTSASGPSDRQNEYSYQKRSCPLVYEYNMPFYNVSSSIFSQFNDTAI